MVENTREKTGFGAVLPIGIPQLILVKTDGKHWPVAVWVGSRWLASQVLDLWRIDDEWWRREPLSRLYFSVLLGEGQRLILFQDLVTGQWFRQNAG